MERQQLRKLRRVDLIELLLELTRENSTLRERLEEAEKALQERKISIAQSGSMAEAAMKLAGVFQAADEACQIYRENYQRLIREMPHTPAETEDGHETEEIG